MDGWGYIYKMFEPSKHSLSTEWEGEWVGGDRQQSFTRDATQQSLTIITILTYYHL